MLDWINVRKVKHGIREVSVVLNGHKLEPFLVYPEVYDLYPTDEKFLSYIERQASALFELFGDEHGFKTAA